MRDGAKFLEELFVGRRMFLESECGGSGGCGCHFDGG